MVAKFKFTANFADARNGVFSLLKKLGKIVNVTVGDGFDLVDILTGGVVINAVNGSTGILRGLTGVEIVVKKDDLVDGGTHKLRSTVVDLRI